MRALSGATRQLSQRESPWHVGQVYAGRAKHNISGTVVRCCQDSRQLDRVRCPEAAGPVSEARPFASCRASVVQWKVTRPAKASPFGRGVTEGDGEGKPGTKEHLHSDKHWLLIESSYRCVFVLSQYPCPLRRFAPAPPKGEPLACRSGFHWTSKARCLGNGSAPLSRPAAA